MPATLSLTLGTPASFGAFTPGVDRTYDASTTATVTSTAGDATLSVTDPSADRDRRLVNGSFALSEPLQVRANAGAFAPLPAAVRCLLVRRPGQQRRGLDRLPSAHRRDAGAADRGLQQDPDVHALDHHPVKRRAPAAASAAGAVKEAGCSSASNAASRYEHC